MSGDNDNPFAQLSALRGSLPAGTPIADAPPEDAPPAPPRRAVIRLERKGRRGKDVTIVSQLGLPPAELARWLKQLRTQLGCGGAVEGEDLAIQGDQRKRLPELLKGLGVLKVVGG